jgi:hypothetical protein
MVFDRDDNKIRTEDEKHDTCCSGNDIKSPIQC